MQGLTKRQREILDFIEHYTVEKRCSPSFRELQAHFGFQSVASVYNHIHALKRKKALESSSSKALPILAEKERVTKEIPLIGSLRGGMPITTFAAITSLPLPLFFLPGHLLDTACYFLQVEGQELEEERMQEGDLLLVEAASSFEDGNMVLAEIGGTTTCIKRAFFDPPYIRLKSENPHLQPMMVREDHLHILGVVHLIFRRYSS